MMQNANAMKWAGCAIGAVLLAVSASGQSKAALPPGFVATAAADVKTGTIYGDPTKPGMYVTRNRFAAGTGSRPHYHDQDRYVTVISGTWWVHLGPESDVYSPEKMTSLKPGSFVVHPAFGHHYDGAKDEDAIVQIMGMGPVKTVQLEAGRGGAPAPAPGDE